MGNRGIVIASRYGWLVKGVPWMFYLGLAVPLLVSCSERPGADPGNVQQVSRGLEVYRAHCAACHGIKLEGQPNWRERLPSGRLPAPPHDASGHTWHHPDRQLFDITKHGVERYAPPGYRSDMPAFGGRIADADIWAVLAYIKSTWPAEIRRAQVEADRNAQKR